MNSDGIRTPDANCCVHSTEALKTMCETAVARCRILKPTTHRYFLWGDDGAEGCRCPRCLELSFSDQALLLENALLKALKTIDPQATLAHLAYEATYAAPQTIKPDNGIFLEFAPIRRSFDQPLRAQTPHWDALQTNLEWFGRDGSQVLDYWIDISLFSQWVRPSPELPDRSKVLGEDLIDFAQTGIEHIRSFAVMLDQEYVDLHGDAPLTMYGRAQQSPSV
jgi:hypothetical protein